MDDAVDARIAVIAARQYRNITRRQLLTLGVSRDTIARRLRKGALYPVHPGVYSVGGSPVTVYERAYAAVLACGDTAVLSYSSAMTLWGFYRRWDFPFEVTTPRDRRPKGVTVHLSRTLAGPDRDEQLGIPVTSPARTVLDIAPRLGDDLPKAVDKALLTKYVTKNMLAEAVDLHPGHPGTKLILPFVTSPDGKYRSKWERGFPDECVGRGLPRPIMGAHVLGKERDAWFPVERTIAELDGWATRQVKTAFEDDRERDAAALEHDIITVRITWDRYYGAPDREFARLDRILARRRAYFSRS